MEDRVAILRTFTDNHNSSYAPDVKLDSGVELLKSETRRLTVK